MAQLWSVTCNMGLHSVTCYPTQVNTPRLNPSHAGRYSIHLPRRDGRLSWPSWPDSAPAGSRTSDLSITSLTPNQCNHQDNQEKAGFATELFELIVFDSLIMSRLMYYASPSWSGYLNVECASTIQKLFTKPVKWGVTSKSYGAADIWCSWRKIVFCYV